MALDNLYEQELSQAGPRARGPLKRSYYLQRALDEIGKQGPGIKSGAALATNLMAEALLQYGRNKQDKKAEAANLADAAQSAKDWGSLFPQPAPEQPPVAPPAIPPQPQAAALPNGFNMAPNMDMGAVAKSRDLVARIMAGESGTDAGQQAAASVVFNRARQSGLTPDQVVTAKGQFEPYGNPQTRARLMALQGPQLDRALSNVDAASQAPTTQADHFFGPQAQAALGRQPPAWGGAPGQMIGGNMFSRQGYAAPTQPGAIQPPISTQPPPMQMAQMAAGPGGVDNTGTPPPPQMPPQAPQMAQGGPQARGLASITPQERAYVGQLLSSADPRERARGEQMKNALIQKAMEPVQWQTTSRNNVPVAYNPQNPSQTMAVGGDSPAFQTRAATPQEVQALGYPAGTTGQIDPNGNFSAKYQPAPNYQSAPGGGQTYIPGSAADPSTGMNRLQGLKELRGELKPVLDAATSLKRNISNVRLGFAQHNGPGDIAMTNGLQKLIDEGIVKEGDINLQLRAQGVEGGIAGLMAFMKSDGVFDERIRRQVAAAAESLYGGMNQTYRDRALGYKGVVERTYGPGSFNDVLPPETIGVLGWDTDPSKAAEPAAPAQNNRTPGGFTPAQAQAAKPYAGAKGPVGEKERPYAPRTQAEFDSIPPGKWYISDDGYVGRK